MLLVIPDTNTLFSDPFLEGPLIRTILAAENQTNIRLVISEVVVDELRNKVEERLKQNVEDARKVRRDYARLSGLNPYAVDFSVSPEQRRAVLERFDQRMAQLTKEGRILKYPSPSLKELACRSIKSQAPFQDKDRGMRDTLIWLTVKECAISGTSAGSTIALVTQDGAFLDRDKTKLNESLMREVADAGIPLDSITVYPTLQGVIDTFISGKLPHVEWVKVAIEGGRIDDFTNSSDAVSLKVTDWIYDNPDILESGDYEFVEFDVVEDVVFCGTEQEIDSGSGEVIVVSEWICNVAADGYLSPYFSENLTVALRFTLVSTVKVENDLLSVIFHEVTDVDVVSVSETEQSREL